ncbi:MAG: Gmad2 immunoglobulin-like domain-containing protein, partial [Nocardioides sp.]
DRRRPVTDDRRLHELLSDAVDDVEPHDRIAEIRERTQTRTGSPRSRWYAVGGAVLATAAAVTAVAVVSSTVRDPGSDPEPGATATSSPSAAPEELQAVPAYFVGETGRGPRLYREFSNVDADVPKLEAALFALEGTPGDPDYTSYWSAGSFAGASAEADADGTAGVISVELADAALRDRPATLSATQADLAVEQVIYTVQAAVGQGRWPVQFRFGDNPIDQVYGVPTSEPLANSPEFDVLSLMNVTVPYQGMEVTDTLVARGVNNSFEATVIWRIEDQGGNVVLDGFTTAQGWTEPRLFPWKTDPIDVSGLEPGGYTFIASNDDPSGGAEGNGPDSDTRLFLIE